MDDNLKHIVTYIQEHRQRGISDQDIANHMRNHGWTDDWLSRAFAAAGSSNPYPVPVPPAAQQPAAPALAQTSARQPVLPAPTEKYKVFQAVADTFVVAKRNPLTIIGSTVVAFIVLVLGSTPITLLLVPQLAHRNPIVSIIFMLFSLAFVLACGAALISGFSIALAASAQGQHITIKQVLKRTLAVVPRVILANFLSFLATAGPIFVLICITIVMAAGQHAFGGAMPLIMAALAVAASVWALIATLRFVLVPYVVTFEPRTPVIKSLSRSYYLMRHGGQWFVVKGFFLLVAIGIVLSAITGIAANKIGQSSNVLLVIINALASIAAYSALVMLYLNRAAVKGPSS